VSTAERRAREKEQRRQAILDAAREVFFQRGFQRATVDDVAARAEVSKGTVYLYFPSKEAILAHLLLEGLSILFAKLTAAYTPNQASASERLRLLAYAYLQFAQEHPNYFRLVMAFDRGRFQEQIPPELNAAIFDRSTSNLKLVAEAVEQGVRTGEFKAVDPWQTAGVLWAALHGVLVLLAHPLRRQLLNMDLDVMFQATLDLLLSGLKVEKKN